MKILILEDDGIRIGMLRKYFDSLGHDLTICTEAEEAIAALYDCGDYDLLFLDHDLGGESFVDSSRDDTGAAVARWLANEETIYGQPYSRHVAIVIHSMNPIGQRNILHILERGGFTFAKIVPFSQIARLMDNQQLLQ